MLVTVASEGRATLIGSYVNFGFVEAQLQQLNLLRHGFVNEVLSVLEPFECSDDLVRVALTEEARRVSSALCESCKYHLLNEEPLTL